MKLSNKFTQLIKLSAQNIQQQSSKKITLSGIKQGKLHQIKDMMRDDNCNDTLCDTLLSYIVM